jgi:hypothetical protein
MMNRNEIIKNVLIIFCIFILLIIPWASVFGIQDPGLIKTIGIFQRITGTGILTYIVITIIYQIYQKSQAQEMKEEEIKEADQKDTKQLLFKPTIGVLIFFLLFTVGPLLIAVNQFIKNKVDYDFIFPALIMIIIIFCMWYVTPVFIFTEDSVQIKSFLFYFFRIDRKTVIKYADITSVRPDAKFKGNMYGFDRRWRIEISAGDIKKIWPAPFYNSDIIAKIYLRFEEKLGDKVKLR